MILNKIAVCESDRCDIYVLFGIGVSYIFITGARNKMFTNIIAGLCQGFIPSPCANTPEIKYIRFDQVFANSPVAVWFIFYFYFKIRRIMLLN